MDNEVLLDKMDKTLQFIVNTSGGSTMPNFKQYNPDLWSRDSEYIMAIDKLIEDKFVKVDENGGGEVIHRPTIHGLTFNGYSASFLQSKRVDTLENLHRENQTNMVSLTRWIAIAAILSGGYYLWELLKPILGYFFH